MAAKLRMLADQLEAQAALGGGSEPLPVLSVQECADDIGLSKHAVWKAIREGALECVRDGSRVWVPRDAWDEWKAARELSGLTVDDVAALLKVGRQTVRNWVNRGQLPGHKVVGRLMIEPDDVAAFAKSKGLQLDKAELEARAA